MASDLHMKLEYLRANNASGRVATFATGTPIRNTVTQAYVMTRFMRPDLLKEAGIHSFDQWAATFGQTVDEMELKPEGIGFRQTTRFAKFRNVPELLRLFHMFADIKMADDLDLNTPDLATGAVQNVVVPASDELRAYVQQLGKRAGDVRSGQVRPEEDNMLKISGDGRKAALSMQLAGGRHAPGKIEAAAVNIAKIWQDTKDRPVPKNINDPAGGDDPPPGGMQLVFCDMGTPSGKGWNAYGELRRQLVDRGMDPNGIRFMHDAKNDREKAELFAAARNGQVQVLIGSTEKMGVGTNVQRRAVALHHLDAPWRPSDVEQRDGRIMRQGNTNKEVAIFRYVTEGSFDAYM
ncbi:MAG: helicase-related protein, partial [Pseudonocardiaceae bacterium]